MYLREPNVCSLSISVIHVFLTNNIPTCTINLSCISIIKIIFIKYFCITYWSQVRLVKETVDICIRVDCLLHSSPCFNEGYFCVWRYSFLVKIIVQFLPNKSFFEVYNKYSILFINYHIKLVSTTKKVDYFLLQ